MSLGLFAISCSNDSTENVTYDDTNVFKTKSLSTGINLGYIDENGNDFVYNDSIAFIKEQWERNYSTTITSFSIEKQLTIPNPDIPGDLGGKTVYLLIGESSSGSHIATSVEPVLDLTYVRLFLKESSTLTVQCSGCASGCHIASYDSFKGKSTTQYSCSDPCSTCSKTETLTNAPF